MTAEPDFHLDATSGHQVGLMSGWPEEWPLPAVGTSEMRWTSSMAGDCPPERDQEGAEYAVALAATAYGLHVGERPRCEPDPFEVTAEGRRRYRVRVLVTRDPDWCPPPSGHIPGQFALPLGGGS